MEPRQLLSAAPSLIQLTLTATQKNASSINLSWNQFQVSGFYCVLESSDNWRTSTWLGNTGGTSYTADNLSPGTTYSFVLLAVNGQNWTWSNNASATTSLRPIQTEHPNFGPDSHYVVVPDSLWNGSPSWNDVHQGWVGDCWLEATISQVGARNPAFVENMFTDLGYFDENGATVHCWNVRIYDSNLQPHEILVDNEFPVSSQGDWMGNGNGSGAIWASLIEKAYVIAAQAGYARIFGTPSNSYYDVWSGTPTWALRAITGHEPIDNYFTKNPDVDTAGVNNYYNNNYYVCLETVGTWDSRIVANHSYSLESVASGVYTVNNPWGSLLAIDGATLSKNFSDYDVCVF